MKTAWYFWPGEQEILKPSFLKKAEWGLVKLAYLPEWQNELNRPYIGIRNAGPGRTWCVEHIPSSAGDFVREGGGRAGLSRGPFSARSPSEASEPMLFKRWIIYINISIFHFVFAGKDRTQTSCSLAISTMCSSVRLFSNRQIYKIRHRKNTLEIWCVSRVDQCFEPQLHFQEQQVSAGVHPWKYIWLNLPALINWLWIVQ